MILECSSLLTCVHLRFPSCRTSRVDVESGCWGYDLLYFPSNQETKTEKALSPRCRSLNTMLAIFVFGYLESLQEVWSFRVDFGSHVVVPPHRRWDLRTPKLHALRRKPLPERFICQILWRCAAHRDVKQLKIV